MPRRKTTNRRGERGAGAGAGAPETMIGNTKQGIGTPGEIVEVKGGEMIGVISISEAIGMSMTGDLEGMEEIEGDEGSYISHHRIIFEAASIVIKESCHEDTLCKLYFLCT